MTIKLKVGETYEDGYDVQEIMVELRDGYFVSNYGDEYTEDGRFVYPAGHRYNLGSLKAKK